MERTARVAGVTALLIAAFVPLRAQTGQVAGPVVGFVFDRAASSLRPILGIPGASVLGNPLTLGYAVSSAAVAPRQDSAFAFAADGSLHFLRLNSGAATEANCPVCPSTAEAAVFSPSGTAAALYAAGRVQIVTGLPGAPTAGATLAVGSMGETRVGAAHKSSAPPMALSDDGAWLLDSGRDSVEVLSANGGPRRLIATLGYAPVAFAPGGHDAAVADGKAGVVLFHDVSGQATQQQLAPSTAPVKRPTGVAFSSDGSHVFATAGPDGSVMSIEVASGTNTTIQCGCTPSGLVSMGAVLRLNELGAGPVWLVDNGGTQPRVVFVPALAAAQ